MVGEVGRVKCAKAKIEWREVAVRLGESAAAIALEDYSICRIDAARRFTVDLRRCSSSMIVATHMYGGVRISLAT